LILGIPRGGVVVADVLAQKLNADLDIVISRKLRAPDNKENSIGAIMPDG
jgi:putative phosphoribosyl transferase